MDLLSSSSLNHGARILSGSHIQLEPHPLPIRAPGMQVVEEPTIHLIRHGTDVEAIEVHCRCGEIIRIRLDYAG